MLRKMSGVKVVEEEKVAETSDVQKTMESMINLDGATLVFPDLVRLFRPAHAEGGAEIPGRGIPPLRRHVQGRSPSRQYRQLFRLYRRGPVPQRHRRRPCHQVEEAGLRRGQADPAGAAQHQRLHAGRAVGRSDDHHAGHLHRRLVDAGQGGGGDKRAGQCRRRCHHLPCGQPQGRRGDRRAARDLHLRLPRQSGPAGAQGLPDRGRVELDHRLQGLRREDQGRREAGPVRPRRFEGRLHQDVILWTGGQRGSEGGGRSRSRRR